MTPVVSRSAVRRGTALGTAALILGSILLTLAVFGSGELLLRWTRPSALLASRAHREHVYSAVYGWALRPNWHGEWKNGKTFSVNAAGYRGRALAEPRAGRRRVLILGDSIAFGAGVDDRETFAQRLQSVGSGFEVANLSVSGYGTDQELRQLEQEGFDLTPDAVVLNFCVFNDYVDNMLESYLHDEGTPKPYYVLRKGELELQDAHLQRSWTMRLGMDLRERSHLVSALMLLTLPATRADAMPTAAPPEHWVSRRNRVLENLGLAADLTTRLIARMGGLCRARRIDFLVLLHPDREAYMGEAKLVTPLESPSLESGGIRVVDLRRHYWAAGLEYELIAFDDIGHLTPTGHAFAAEMIRQELR